MSYSEFQEGGQKILGVRNILYEKKNNIIFR